jgi:hypothetical protein
MSHADPPTLLAKIDWYSFTLPLTTALSETGVDTLEAINFQLAQLPMWGFDPLSADGTWRVVPAHGFYEYVGTHLLSGLSVSWGSVNAHLFVQLPGAACDFFRHQGCFLALVKATSARTSRVDAAIDILTATRPVDFVRAGFAKRFQGTHGHIVSETGETLYVGNRKSDRCARVYRYSPPHPRAAFLRVEAEYKSHAARALAAILAVDGEREACIAAHKIFEWASPEMKVDFLVHPHWPRDRATSLDTANTAGSTLRSYPLSFDTSKMAFWTLSTGWLKWFYRRWKRRLIRFAD